MLSYVSRHLIAPLWALWEGSPYLRHYRSMLKTQYNTADEISDYQLNHVRSLLRYAYQNVPFWKNRIDSSGMDPDKIASLKELQSLPLLTKQDIRQYGNELLSPQFDLEKLHKHTTSGSTGISITTYRDEECQQFKRGAILRSDEWSGWKQCEPVASVWGNPEIRADWRGKLRRRLLERNYAYLDTLKMDVPAIERFIQELLEEPPSLLFGHAHSLFLLAKYIKSKHGEISIRPNGIISTCMLLHDFERKVIEEVFARPVVNRYGCEEVSLIASECDRTEGLHVNADCIYLEIIDEHGNLCEPGTTGRVVVTDLQNRAMPIIRYEVGDMACWSDRQCSCGRTLPVLQKIEGRVADYVVTSRGEYISGISLTENFALKVPGVEQMQIIQEDYDEFIFNIVKDNAYSDESLSVLDALVNSYFGEGAHYSCNYLETIPAEPSGKYRFCISKVSKEFN